MAFAASCFFVIAIQLSYVLIKAKVVIILPQ